ncbi:zinc finger protein 616-like [Aphis craccivora]|uniref:Zinc finger protein 616-like n=1 Tax=Aphis craccivora TaxID=307492 RepID=A0A6G0YN90_APHCR|nr:zinc finger protein 616-like [Aphis craccivora]
MLNSNNNNVDSEKWQEIVLDEIQSDIENYSDNELPLSSIVATNNTNTRKWQDNIQSIIKNDSKNELPLSSISIFNDNHKFPKQQEINLDDTQSDNENCSDNELPLSSISMFNDNQKCPKHQEINLDDTQSDNENCSDYELPLSSIANVLLPIDSCKVQQSESIDCQSKELNKIDTPMKKYGCDICGKIFLRRIAIIEHFRTSLCFPDSPFDFELKSPNYNLCNNSDNPMSFVKNLSNLETTNMNAITYKCRICQNVITNYNFIKRRQILNTKDNHLCNICSILNSIACGNNQHLKEKYTWKCKSCGQKFTKLSVLKAHRCVFPKNILFNCYKCHKSYKTVNALEKHKNIHKFNCNICHKRFFKQSTLTNHKKVHCLKSIDQRNIRHKYLNSSVLKHTNNVHNSSQNYECSRCSEVFHKRSEIIAHIFENHQEDYSKYSCDECTNLYDSSQDYILCLAKNCCKCDVCPQSFTTTHRLQQHYGWHLGINSFKCQFCPKTFSKCSLYLSHERTHTGEKPFRCHFCGKWFPDTSNLNIHLKPYKLFKCNICQKSYTQMSSLLFHKRTHAKEKRLEKNMSYNQLTTLDMRTKRQYTTKNNFNCKVCNKSFYHAWSLNKHVKTHQSNKNVKKSFPNKYKRPQENEHFIKCDLCNELFRDQNILMTHRCKSSTCKFCFKVFNNVSSLKRHYRYVHQKNNELFDCDICKISFMCLTSLNEHIKRHTHYEKNPPLTCNVNNKVDTTKQEMYRNEEYKCDLCMKSFFSQTQIFAHILETHY